MEAVRRFAAAGSVKVAILDLDFHHGNGTQSAFYHDPTVLYVSIHGQGEYPYYTGSTDETGDGEGKGYNLNLPLPAKSSAARYLEMVDIATRKIGGFKPSCLIVSLGFDTFYLDPLGAFDLQTEDYETIARAVRGAAGVKGLPSLILLEGGYVVEKLGSNLLHFLKGWELA